MCHRRVFCAWEGMASVRRRDRLNQPRGQMRSCFVVTVRESPTGGAVAGLFRDPIGPRLLSEVADELRSVGFRVTDAKPGKACDAAFTVSFDKFRVSVVLLATRRSGFIHCAVLTWLTNSSWRSTVPDSARAEWDRVCAVAEQALKHNKGIVSCERLTRAEAEQYASIRR